MSVNGFAYHLSKRINWPNWLAMALTGLCLASCQNLVPALGTPTSITSGQAGCSVKIGVITSLSGDFAGRAQELTRGYEMARDDINAAGGISGCTLELVVKDDASSARQGAARFEELAEKDQVPLIVGSFSSDVTLGLVPLATQYQIPLLAHNAASALVTRLGSEWVFRTISPEDVAIADLLDYATSLLPPAKVPSVALAYEDTAFGHGAARRVADYAKSAGIGVVAAEAFAPNSADFKPLLRRLQRAEPDIVFLSANELSDALLLLEQSQEIDLNAQAYLSNGGALTSAQFLESPYSDYWIISVPWDSSVGWQGADGQTVEDFGQRFQTRYGVPPLSRSVNAYVNIQLAGQALAPSAGPGSSDTQDVARLRRAVRDRLRQLDLPETLFGPIKFDEAGQNKHRPLLAQIIQGQLIIVSPEAQSTGQVVFPAPPWSQRSTVSQ